MNKSIARIGLLVTISLMLSYIERFFIIPVPVPGIKLGLANMAVVMALYIIGVRAAVVVSILKVLLSALLFGSVGSLMFSMGGALLALIVMISAKHLKSVSIIGVSALGGISHNIGQILVAALVVHNMGLLYYLPILLAAGGIMGVVNGLVSRTVVYYVGKSGVR
jgi:heptaprenyl diphosphate synthase